jgi:hypothetical protein
MEAAGKPYPVNVSDPATMPATIAWLRSLM